MVKWRDIYLTTVSLVGFGLALWGIVQIPTLDTPLIFLLLLVLAVTAQLTSTAVIGGEVTVEVGTAISLATVPLYGPVAGALVAASSQTGLSLMSMRADRPPWRRALERIGFNAGMGSISIFVAGLVYVTLSDWIGAETLLGQLLPWLPTAVTADQINIWLLIAILHLQHGVNPMEIWQEHRWAIPMNVLVLGMGGGLLSFAVQEFGVIGVGIFFLPIFLSAYAFRLYVNRTKEQMTKLEELVDLRTRDLSHANEELANLHEEKDAFLAVLTHDMRTPLTSIQGYASLIRDHDDMPPEQRKHMARVIMRNERTLYQMVNNILEIQQLQSGVPLLLERENFDLVQLVDGIVESLTAQATEKEIEISQHYNVDPLYIHADKSKLHRVVQNLVSNAIKYTPNGGSVTITGQLNGSDVTLEVSDTGFGIPAEDLPHIFDRFRRVRKHEDKAIGTGLGLAIVQGLIEAHDGEITVTSVEDEGSTFTMRLPA